MGYNDYGKGYPSRYQAVTWFKIELAVQYLLPYKWPGTIVYTWITQTGHGQDET
jgi:hypothetical protein